MTSFARFARTSSLILFTLGAQLAVAESFSLNASGSGIFITATLNGVADPFTAGAFDVLSGSGFVNGIAISLVTPSGTSQDPQFLSFVNKPAPLDGSYSYDNVVYPIGHGGVALDPYGLLFALPDDYLNLVGNQAYSFSTDEILSGSSSPLTSFALTPLAATPEPSAFALLGSGALCAGAALRRRRLQSR